MGVNVLETLGSTDDEIEAAGGFPDSGIAFYNRKGDRIAELDGTNDVEAYGARSYIIKRGRLAGLLREAAIERGVRLEFGSKLEAIEIDDGVSASFEDGTVARGDFLVGGDGVHSTTRRLAVPDAPVPEYTGLIDCGGFTDRPSSVSSSSAMHMTYGKRALFGYLAKPDDEVYWFDNLPWPDEPARGELDALSNEAWKRRLIDAHCDDPASIAEIVQSTDGEIGTWPLYDLPSLSTWHEGRSV